MSTGTKTTTKRTDGLLLQDQIINPPSLSLSLFFPPLIFHALPHPLSPPPHSPPPSASWPYCFVSTRTIFFPTVGHPPPPCLLGYVQRWISFPRTSLLIVVGRRPDEARPPIVTNNPLLVVTGPTTSSYILSRGGKAGLDRIGASGGLCRCLEVSRSIFTQPGRILPRPSGASSS